MHAESRDNSDAYMRTLTELTTLFKQVQPHKNSTEILFQHDIARPHTHLKAQEAVTNFGWIMLTHPPYSSDLAPLDLNLFGALKVAIHSTKFETDDIVIHAVKTWLCEQNNAWY
jgi:histone-lysine N-methyltransferase SETMAR